MVDTADVYASGRSEEMLGGFIAERGLRDRIVVSTKAGFAAGQGPHGGGSGARHLHAAIDSSLRRLRTDHVDLYWLHVWDGVTPAEEVLETMAGLVRSGKIRYWGLSNAPAWWCAKLATLAVVRGVPGPIALQPSYSLASREVEDEHVPLAAEAGMAIVPWSPLAYGLLTGKYDRRAVESAAPRTGGLPREAAIGTEIRPADDRRLDGANPFGDSLFTERNWRIVDELRRIAAEVGVSPARLALSWVMSRPGVGTALIGVSRLEQLADNVAALELELAPDHLAALDAVSIPSEPRMLSRCRVRRCVSTSCSAAPRSRPGAPSKTFAGLGRLAPSGSRAEPSPCLLP